MKAKSQNIIGIETLLDGMHFSVDANVQVAIWA